MSLDSSTVRITYTDNASVVRNIDIRKPLWGYETLITMPIDFSRQADSSYDYYDSGTDGSLDVRQCQCDFYCDETEQATLEKLRNNTEGRARNLILELSTSSGFFPFGADLGDTGNFNVSIEFLTVGSIGMAPFRHFKNTVRFTMFGTPTSYSIPTDETLVGPVTIGDVSNLRFPDLWFNAQQGIGSKTTIMNGGTAIFVNRGGSADSFSTEFELRMRNARAARLLKYITSYGRAEAFSAMPLITPTGCFPFGRGKATGGTFSVRLIQDTLSIKHVGFQQFNMTLNLAYISG